MMLRTTISALLFSVAFTAPPLLAGEACYRPIPQAQPSSSECASEIIKELNYKTDELQVDHYAAANLLARWNEVFKKEYFYLRGQGLSQSDAQLIQNRIKDEIDPINIFTEKAIDWLVKKYLSTLSGLLEILSKAPAMGLSIFFTPSETATDLDELISLNNRVGNEFTRLYFDKLDPTWKQRVLIELKEIDPKTPVILPAH